MTYEIPSNMFFILRKLNTLISLQIHYVKQDKIVAEIHYMALIVWVNVIVLMVFEDSFKEIASLNNFQTIVNVIYELVLNQIVKSKNKIGLKVAFQRNWIA